MIKILKRRWLVPNSLVNNFNYTNTARILIFEKLKGIDAIFEERNKATTRECFAFEKRFLSIQTP